MKKITQLSFLVGMLVPLSVLADTVITVPTTTAIPYLTSIYGNITIAPTGNLIKTTSGSNAITIDTPFTSVIVDPNNINPLAIANDTGPGSTAIEGASPVSMIKIGANSTVSGYSGNGTIYMSTTGGTIENYGTILGHLMPSIFVSNGIRADADLSLNNAGTILSKEFGVIVTGFGNILNTGLIHTTGNIGFTVVISDGGFLTNSGTITSDIGRAIDLQGSNANVLFTNNASGIVNGNVFLSNDTIPGGVVLQMNGGTINGTVFVPVGIVPRILNVAGGTIVGGIDMGTFSLQADVINQSGGTIGNILGRSTFNQSLNITGPVTTGGSITNVDNINVLNNAVFKVVDPITNAQVVTVAQGTLDNNSQISTANLTINADGLFIADTFGTANVSNTLTNNGTLFLKVPVPNSNVNVTTNVYTQSNSGVLEVAIKDINNFGHMNITGAGVTNINGDILKVILDCGLIRNLDTFDIIHETGAGIIVGEFNIIQPTSASLFFIQVNTPKDVILEAIRIPFREVVCEDNIARSPATAIDAILSSDKPLSPDFESFIIALDNLEKEGVDAALRTTVPQFDGGLADLSRRMRQDVFQGLGRYIDKNRCLNGTKSGYVSGDVTWGRLNHEYPRRKWAKIFGTSARQKENCLSEGYDLSDTGFIVGYDGHYSDNMVLGAALSYATGEVSTRDISNDRQAAKSFQLTAYSTYDCKGSTYLDMMAGVAYNQYASTRHIFADCFCTSSKAKFSGVNYGFNVESGYLIPCGNCHFIPLASLLYSRLQINHYTETGAGGLNLSTWNEPVQEGITAIGFKLNSARFYRAISYVPEFRFNIRYDWLNYGQSMQSEFLEGGPSFITHAFNPPPCTYNVGLSLNAFICKNMVLALNYDLDLRSAYSADNVSVKFSYEW